MNKLFNKFFKTAQGFSLVEILVAVSVLGFGSFAVMKTMEVVSQESERGAVQVDFEQFLFGLDNYLGRENVCTENLLHKNIDTDIPFIKDPISGETFLQAGGEYLDGKIIIESMKLIKLDDAVPALRINFKRRDTKKSDSAYLYTRTVPIVHELDASLTKIEKCYELETSDFNLAEKLCHNNGIYDSLTSTCNFVGFGEDVCPAGEVITNIDYDSVSYTLKPVCSPVVNNVTCPDTWITSISDQGVQTCLPEFSSIVSVVQEHFSGGPARSCGLDISTGSIKFLCDGAAPPPPPPCVENAVRKSGIPEHTVNYNYCGDGIITGDIYKYNREVCIGGNWVAAPGACFRRTQNICTPSSNKCIPPTEAPENCSVLGIENYTGYNIPMAQGGTFKFQTFIGIGCTPPPP